MPNIAQPRCTRNDVNLPVPLHIISYVDVLRGWREWKLSAKQLAILKRNCFPKLGKKPVTVWRQKCPFTGRVSYRYALYRPNRVALSVLQEAEHFTVTYAEPAIDLIFADSETLDEAERLLDMHLVQPRHRGKRVNLYRFTRYSGPRSARNNLVSYSDKTSRISQERHCLHIELRIRGSETLQRHGFFGVGNFIHMEVTEFWRKHLRFYTFDREKAGRLFRRGRESGFTDTQIGNRLWHASGFSNVTIYKSKHTGRRTTIQSVVGKMQQFVDTFRRVLRVERCLKQIDAEAWIPTEAKRSTQQVLKERETGVFPREFHFQGNVAGRTTDSTGGKLLGGGLGAYTITRR